MKYAIVKSGVVVNLIEYVQQPSTPPAGFDAGHEAIQADSVNIGWVYANGQFTDTSTPVTIDLPTPKSLTDLILADPAELAKLKQALGL
jgi:hypothetical protein